MPIDHAKEAALLSYALELAATCSPQFHGHVTGMIQEVLTGEFPWEDGDFEEVREEIAMFREESPTGTPIDLPAGLAVSRVTPALVDMVFAEIVHRVKWDIVMAKTLETTKFLSELYQIDRKDGTQP